MYVLAHCYYDLFKLFFKYSNVRLFAIILLNGRNNARRMLNLSYELLQHQLMLSPLTVFFPTFNYK